MDKTIDKGLSKLILNTALPAMILGSVLTADSLPESTEILITMGLSIRHSSISSLMSLIARMHFQAKSVNGVWSYFHADVKDVLLHPLVKFFNHDEATTLINHINWHNSYQVTFDTIAEFAPNLAPLFTVVKDLTLSEIEQYITTILDFTRKVYEQKLQLEKAPTQPHPTTTIATSQQAPSMWSKHSSTATTMHCHSCTMP